jgi:hypothetical protein
VKDRASTITSSTGGVMTVEVGAITGELEVATRPHPQGTEVKVRYAGAEEWYPIEGSPLPAPEPHERVLDHLTTPRKQPPVTSPRRPHGLPSYRKSALLKAALNNSPGGGGETL